MPLPPMNRTEAQFILGACPPGPLPTDDPQVAEALALAEQDPELSRWLRETRAFDAAVAVQLRQVAPPADLRAALLAGRRLTPVVVRPRWRQPQWLALAALVVLCLGLTGLWLGRGDATAAGFRTAAAQFLSDTWQHEFDLPEQSFPKIREWLAQQPGGLVIQAPAALAAQRTYGCKVWNWRGHRATLVCFVARGTGDVIHIVSVDRKELPAEVPVPDLAAPQFARTGDWNTALWSQEGRVYVALTAGASRVLADHLRPEPL